MTPIAALGRAGPPSKVRAGRFVFLCPRCGEMLAYVNPRTNLAHCFACHVNLNAIDLLRALGYDFRSAVALLDRWLTELEAGHRRQRSGSRSPAAEFGQNAGRVGGDPDVGRRELARVHHGNFVQVQRVRRPGHGEFQRFDAGDILDGFDAAPGPGVTS